MKLSEFFRPKTLSDVVGQPSTQLLALLASNPAERCLILEGPPGVGKTTSALAYAAALGCDHEFSGLELVISTELTIERARQIFERDFRLRPLEGKGWHVLIIEELEACASATVGRYLKTALERLPPRCVVIATSNATDGIEPALLQRFTVCPFINGPAFATACWQRLAEIWKQVCGALAMPNGWRQWGWTGEQFSMRSALDQLEMHSILAKGGA